MDSSTRRSTVTRGRLLVVGLRRELHWSDIYWRKQLHYVARFIVRHSDDVVLLVSCLKPADHKRSSSGHSAPAGFDPGADATAVAEPGSHAALLARARALLTERYDVSEQRIRTLETVVPKHQCAGHVLRGICEKEQADLLVIGTRPGPAKGFLGTRRTGHTKDYLKHHLKGTRLVAVHPPECWIWDHKLPS